MQFYKCKLSDVAKVDISSVDKKAKENETTVRLCNFTDVYHNWAITSDMASSFMEASANANYQETLTKQFEESHKLEEEIMSQLKKLRLWKNM